MTPGYGPFVEHGREEERDSSRETGLRAMSVRSGRAAKDLRTSSPSRRPGRELAEHGWLGEEKLHRFAAKCAALRRAYPGVPSIATRWSSMSVNPRGLAASRRAAYSTLLFYCLYTLRTTALLYFTCPGYSSHAVSASSSPLHCAQRASRSARMLLAWSSSRCMHLDGRGQAGWQAGRSRGGAVPGMLVRCLTWWCRAYHRATSRECCAWRGATRRCKSRRRCAARRWGRA
jgi:hypothetical protein